MDPKLLFKDYFLVTRISQTAIKHVSIFYYEIEKHKKIVSYIINKHIIKRFKIIADKDKRKMSNKVEN